MSGTTSVSPVRAEQVMLYFELRNYLTEYWWAPPARHPPAPEWARPRAARPRALGGAHGAGAGPA